MVSVDGLKCYACTACQDKGTETMCTGGMDACLKNEVGPLINRACTYKNITESATCQTIGLGIASVTNCRCDTDLCNGSGNAKPMIYIMVLALMTRLVFF